MIYELFTTLFKESLDYSSEEMFIAERGWQEWMDQFDDIEKVSFILKRIFYYSTHSLREVREARKLSRSKFSKAYDIPLRTVETWEYGTAKMSNYDRMFVCYTFLIEDLLGSSIGNC